jgi:hypothetical protein
MKAWVPDVVCAARLRPGRFVFAVTIKQGASCGG